MRNDAARRTLLVELTHALTPVLPALLGRLRHLFDLSARPDIIAAQLGQDPLLADAVTRNPGLRIPGAFDPFEMSVRAILGQQITVRGATTMAGRFVDAFGETIETPIEGLNRLTPTPQRIAEASADDLGSLGIIRSRGRSIVAVAAEIASGRLRLEGGADPERTISELVGLPGIGAWTAHYIAMRALRWPDAFPKEDVVLRKRLGGISAAEADARSQAWRPWRSYATLYLWQAAPAGEGAAAPVADGAGSGVANEADVTVSSRPGSAAGANPVAASVEMGRQRRPRA